MPIRLNLLNEAQAVEELRRKDPVKRVIFGAALLVALMLAWSSSLVAKAVMAKSELARGEAQMATQTNQYQTVLQSQKMVSDANKKLEALRRLETNRFLNGNVLDALQKSTVDGVQLTRLKIEQAYSTIEGTKARTNKSRVTPGKPTQVAERIEITLDCKDSSSTPGNKIGQFKETVAANPLFQSFLGKTNEARLTRRSSEQAVPGEPPFVTFTIECRFPEVTR
jgi:hypothetical protein